MKSFYTISLFLLALMLGMGGLSVFAKDQPSSEVDRKECSGKRHRGDVLSQIPGLTEEQKTQIEELKSSFKAETEPVREELREKEDALRAMIKNGDAGQNEIDTLVDEIGALRTSLRKDRIAMRMDLGNILNAEQLDYLDTLHHHPRHKKKHMKNG